MDDVRPNNGPSGNNTGPSGTNNGPSSNGDDPRMALRRLLNEADEMATRLAADAADQRRTHDEAISRELAETEHLRLVLAERIAVAAERTEAAQQLIDDTNRKLVDIDEFHRRAQTMLATASDQASAIVADAEDQAAAIRAQAEHEAVERVRRAERDCADRMAQAESEARQLLDVVNEAAARADIEAELAIDVAAKQLAQAEVDAQRTIQQAADLLAAAEADSEQLADEAMAVLERARAEADRLVENATEARHAEVVKLQAREQAVQDRISELLADGSTLAGVPRADVRSLPQRTPGASEGTIPPAAVSLSAAMDDVRPAPAGLDLAIADAREIDLSHIDLDQLDLTDDDEHADVSGAIRDAIDEWVNRRDAG